MVWEVSELVDNTVLIYFKEYQMTRILLFIAILTTSISGQIKFEGSFRTRAKHL
jgi:hypothetical protein